VPPAQHGVLCGSAFPVPPTRPCRRAAPHFRCSSEAICCRAKAHFRRHQRGHVAGRRGICGAPREIMLPSEAAFLMLRARPCCRSKAHFRRFQLVYDAAVRSCIPRASSEAMLPGGSAYPVPPGRLCCGAKAHCGAPREVLLPGEGTFPALPASL
jgi:hypothetical protein